MLLQTCSDAFLCTLSDRGSLIDVAFESGCTRFVEVHSCTKAIQVRRMPSSSMIHPL